MESESTEESLYYVEEANRRVRKEWDERRLRGQIEDSEQGKLIVGSMDVEALYPSIEVNRSARLVGEMVSESNIEIENVDYDTAVRFIASNSSQSDIVRWGMSEYVPRRKHKTGCRPGATTLELSQRRKFSKGGEEEIRESKWVVKK